ncbi:POK6 protein, partial [Loxia leucoptera]|nr:POK6 protein [Loxia leucoptera]
EWQWITRPLRQEQPIPNMITVFTDTGKESRKAAVTWKTKNTWQHKLLDACPEDSLQTLELLLVVWTCVTFTGPLNVVTDSLYVAGVAQRLEDASVK